MPVIEFSFHLSSVGVGDDDFCCGGDGGDCGLVMVLVLVAAEDVIVVLPWIRLTMCMCKACFLRIRVCKCKKNIYIYPCVLLCP